MTIEELFTTRRQIRSFDSEKIPSRELIEDLLHKTFSLTPSKQNIFPYSVHVIGPEHYALKDELYLLSQHLGQTSNTQSLAPYNLLFTPRLAKPNSFSNEIAQVNIEVGMFSAILTGLCVEQGLSVGYMLCYKDDVSYWTNFPNDGLRVEFTMHIGYADDAVRPFISESKPEYDEVINWYKAIK
tara:strand:- start:6965 stop:7516 length:552 start_codon:yes stop_codon:yes gene_type:complete